MMYLSPFFFLGQTHGFTTIFSGLDDYSKLKKKKKKAVLLKWWTNSIAAFTDRQQSGVIIL